MNNKLVNEYSYSRDPKEDGFLVANHKVRSYKTKKKPSDLLEWYCDVHRYWWVHNMINTKGVVDLNYKWIRENHFMKDSVLRISYSGKIEIFNKELIIGGKKVKSIFDEYTNVEAMVFGNDIFKCLGYIRKYSNFDLSQIKKEFVEQCMWLQENEPEFAPNTDDFGQWFEDTISEDTTELNKNEK